MRRFLSAGLAVGALSAYSQRIENTCQSTNAFCDAKTHGRNPLQRNYAFVFIKPHANNVQTRSLVSSALSRRGLRVLSEGEIKAEAIDRGMLVDRHYYSIASKATLLKPQDLAPQSFEGKFQDKFKISWSDALKADSILNAIDACKYFDVDTAGITALWDEAVKSGDMVKLGGGFYCCKLSSKSSDKKPIFVLNGFFMSMRQEFVTPGTSIHYYNVEFDPVELPWSVFRGTVLGSTNPVTAPQDSLRGMILKDWKKLGLPEAPSIGANGVHASASPFEGLAERMNWFQIAPDADLFGARLISETGISKEKLVEWSLDPQVNGKSVFDQLEDTDSEECIEKIKKLLQSR